MNDFKALKEGKERAFQKAHEAMLDAALADRTKSSFRTIKRRIEQALWEVDREDVFREIDACTEGKRCASLWCPTCRNNASRAALRKLEARIQEKNYDNEDLIHITIPVGLADFSASAVRKVIDDDNLRWKRIRKKRSFWFEGVYEFELVDIDALRNSNGCMVKKKQMTQLIEHQRFTGRKFIYVHIHGVTDVAKSELPDIFGRNYFIGDQRLIKTSDCGIYVQNFRKHQSIAQNIAKLASYPFKSVYRFKHSYIGSDHANGEFFSLEELGGLIALYHDAQGRQWRTLRRNSNGE